jgi:hypothetical protein
MKRYALFAFEGYYPNGGWSDFIGSFETQEEAKNARPERMEYFQVVDLTTGQIVDEGRIPKLKKCRTFAGCA